MSKAESSLAETNHDEGGEFIQVRKKSERTNNDKNFGTTGSSNDKKKPKARPSDVRSLSSLILARGPTHRYNITY